VLDRKDCLYIGMGVRELSFTSADKKDPAKFYFASAPAHAACPTVQVSRAGAQQVTLGATETSNQRTIYQMVHPSVLKSCQLVSSPNSRRAVWNTMPCHPRPAHGGDFSRPAPGRGGLPPVGRARRDAPHRRKRAGRLSPSWSIHSGVGTASYSFIWAMVGENQTFTDIDHVAMADLK
jgi:4-deoxy-L-threo-5-hexosulose-uronate ketol-isomerase